MAYYEARELLENQNATLPDLLDCLERLGIQQGYLNACFTHELRENCGIEITRIMKISDQIKEKINKIVMTEIKLPVKYFNQVNNDTNYFGDGNRQCCLTANAMAAEYLLETHSNPPIETLAQRAQRLGLSEPESAYGNILQKYGDSGDHTANTLALEELRLSSYFSTSLSINNAIASLRKNIPMPIGVHYKSWGHILCLVGVNTDKEFFWVHDPFGIRAGIADYYESVGGQSGKYDKYSFTIMENLWSTMNDGWGRVFTAINGKPTGL